jgi:hypothetical protein
MVCDFVKENKGNYFSHEQTTDNIKIPSLIIKKRLGQ